MVTRSHSIHRLALGLILLGLAACGADATSEEPSLPDAGGTGLTGDIGTTGDETFTDALAGALCDWMLDCCTTSELDDFVAGLATTPGDAETLQLALDLRSDPEACRSLAKGLIVDTLRHADAAVLSGRAAFDEAAASTCLAHFEGGCGLGGAENIAAPDHPCSPDLIVAGQVEAGLLCTDNFECLDTAFCDVALGASFGTCRPWTAPGAPCNQDNACGPSGYCGNAGAMGVCVASSGTLAPYCNSHGDCGDGQYCASTVGSCVDALTDGAVCQGDVFCSSGLCALNTTQTCEDPGGLNELCTRDDDCGQTGYCDESPPDTHRCVAVTQLGIGERCNVGAAVCGDGLVCEDGLCVVRAGIDGPCLHDGYCPSSGWCDAGTCNQRAPIGGMCTSDNQCVSIGWCSGGVCVQRVEQSQPCDQGSRCVVDAYCQFEAGVIGTCKTLPAAGSDCVTGTCAPSHSCVTFAGACSARLEAGQDCERSAMCAADHLCEGPGLASDVCQTPEVVGAGEGCATANVTCGSGLFCAGSVCEAYAVAGAPCTGDDGCVAGTSCVQGLCDSLGGAFATCDSEGDCSTGLFCDPLYLQCTPQKAKDQACTHDDECQATLYCDTSFWTCQWKKANSEPCQNQGQCQEGLYCNVASSCSTRLGAGQTCNVDEACIEGLGCVAGLCTGPASPGMPCDPVMGCVETAVCDPVDILCQALATAGETCDSDAECVSDLFCGAVSSVCALRASEGQACDDNDGCLPSLSCQQSGLCRPRSVLGADCDPLQTQCVEHTLCDSSGVCVGLLADRPIGAPCRHHAQCESLACHNGLCVGHCQGN